MLKALILPCILSTRLRVGLTITCPASPSTSKASPVLTEGRISLIPITAGSLKPLLMIAVCDVLPPDSRTRPFTFCRSMVANAEGLKSCETTIRSPGRGSQLNGRSPERFSRIRSITSAMSLCLSRKYSSSRDSYARMILSIAFMTAHSEFACSFRMLTRISFCIDGSSNMSICVSRITLCSLPIFFSRRFLRTVSCSLD